MKIKLTNMCMIEKDDMVLVQLREKKDWPGITFPGGKVEKHESIYQSVIREVKEETGLDVSNLKFCATVHYDVNDGKEEWVIFLFKTSSFSGELLEESDEGKLYWMNKADLFLEDANLSNDLDVYLKLYEDESLFEGFAKWNGNTSGEFTFYGHE